MNRVRELLENLWVCKDTQKDLYYKIKHEIPLFQKFVGENLGWKLIHTEQLLKLEKIPAHGESFMGIQEFTEIRDYCFLCAVLMFLEDREEEERFLLSELIDSVETQLKTVMEIDWTSFSQRKSLVRVLQFMEKNNMLKVYEGNSEGFGQESGSEVLYENTGYSKYFATSFDGDISNFHTAEDFERIDGEQVKDNMEESGQGDISKSMYTEGADADEGKKRMHRIYRQLAVCPMMYWRNQEEVDAVWLKNHRDLVAENLEVNLGGRLDLHKNVAFWMLEEDDCYGKVHPRDAILPEAVLLVCSVIRSKIIAGVWEKQADECVYITEEALNEVIADCHRRWKEAWGIGFREMETEKAVKEMKDYMETWMMLEKTGEKVRLFPIVGKVSGFYPDDYHM